jgi:hypothetical protein
MIPGWPYSVVAALETRRTSWTAPLDAVRLPPVADVTTIACAQIRQLVDRLIDAWAGAGRGPRHSLRARRRLRGPAHRLVLQQEIRSDLQ